MRRLRMHASRAIALAFVAWICVPAAQAVAEIEVAKKAPVYVDEGGDEQELDHVIAAVIDHRERSKGGLTSLADAVDALVSIGR